MINAINFVRKNILIVGMTSIAVLLFVQLVSAAVTGYLVPVSDGVYKQWTPSTGTTHYVLVDETPCNGNTDYNFSNNLNIRDSYGLDISSVPNGSTMTKIEIVPCASRYSVFGATSTMKVFYRFNNTTTTDAGNYLLSGTTPIELATTTFSGLSLNKTSTSTLEVGAVLTGTAASGGKLSKIKVKITY